MSESPAVGYAGDVSARDAYEGLAKSPDAMLIDVRTAAEWVYVGVPVLSDLGKATVLVEWDEFPSGALLPDFVGRLMAEAERRGLNRDAPLYFICRSGNRSRTAAIQATEAGFTRCYNVEYGFEGRLSGERHRATAGSWKAEGLPWVQS